MHAHRKTSPLCYGFGEKEGGKALAELLCVWAWSFTLSKAAVHAQQLRQRAVCAVAEWAVCHRLTANAKAASGTCWGTAC